MEQNVRQLVLDIEQLFAEGSTIVANGATSSFSLKGFGFGKGTIVLLISALDTTTGDETYDFDIEVSTNNSTWVKWGTIPDAEIKAAFTNFGRALKPFHNQGSEMYKFVRLNATLAGTTPSITFTAYLSEDLMK